MPSVKAQSQHRSPANIDYAITKNPDLLPPQSQLEPSLLEDRGTERESSRQKARELVVELSRHLHTLRTISAALYGDRALARLGFVTPIPQAPAAMLRVAQRVYNKMGALVDFRPIDKDTVFLMALHLAAVAAGLAALERILDASAM